MSREPIWKTKDGRVMARCPDCNKILHVKEGDENIIEVGSNGQPTGVLCQECWKKLERSGGKLS